MITIMDDCESALERRSQLPCVRLHQQTTVVLIIRELLPLVKALTFQALESAVRVPEGNRVS
jgi:hypothetical protein